jgi:hypothetical protein
LMRTRVLQRSVSRLRSEEKDRKAECSVVSGSKRELLCLFLLALASLIWFFFAYSRGYDHPCRGTALLEKLSAALCKILRYPINKYELLLLLLLLLFILRMDR